MKQSSVQCLSLPQTCSQHAAAPGAMLQSSSGELHSASVVQAFARPELHSTFCVVPSGQVVMGLGVLCILPASSRLH